MQTVAQTQQARLSVTQARAACLQQETMSAGERAELHRRVEEMMTETSAFAYRPLPGEFVI
jgi:hypothetical protein